jgi:adenylylsulfate kinase
LDLNVCNPTVLWFTGLSGAGKSTIAKAVYQRLIGDGIRAEFLDGDEIRLAMPTGFTKADRDARVKSIGFCASRLEQHGVTVLCALMSPHADARDFVRRMCRTFIEVYVATPFSECERRDVKGLYAKARRGELRDFTGIDDVYEEPDAPELTLDTTSLSIDEAVGAVLQAWACRASYRQCDNSDRTRQEAMLVQSATNAND